MPKITSVPIKKFIHQHFNDVQGLQMQYLDTIRTECGDETNGKGKQNRHFAAVEKTTPRYPNDINLLYESDSDIEPEAIEQWNKPANSIS